MPRHKNFVNRDVRPQSATEADFEALFARHAAGRGSEPAQVAIDRIRPNPFQARQTFSGIEELAQAIQAQGFTSRLRVRRDPADPTAFQLVFGERRLRAAKSAGLTTVPVEIAEHTDDELIEIGLAENIQRQDLDPLEEAQAFRTFMDQRGYTIVRLAERIGKDRSYVESRLALLRVPEDVQQMVAKRPDTIRTAREIAKLATPEERRSLISGVLAGDLSKEDVRTIVRDVVDHPDNGGQSAEGDPHAPRAEPQVRPASLPAFERRVERDYQTLSAITARWEANLSGLSRPQKNTLRRRLEEHATTIQRLLAALETRK